MEVSAGAASTVGVEVNAGAAGTSGGGDAGVLETAISVEKGSDSTVPALMLEERKAGFSQL